jgi:hypothetical protein
MKPADLISERILFGVLFILGYFFVGGVGAILLRDSPPALQLTRDVLLTIGPLLGVIVNAIWKNDRVDKLNAATAAKLAEKSPDLSGAAVSANPAEGMPQ